MCRVNKIAVFELNFKDALAGTGAGKIIRRCHLVGGIDLSGTMVSVERRALCAGDK